jgi:hypothetical protein
MQNIHCPQCGRIFDNYSEAWIGNRIECAKCGHVFLCDDKHAGVETISLTKEENPSIVRETPLKKKRKSYFSSWVIGIGIVLSLVCYYVWIGVFSAGIPDAEAIINVPTIIVSLWFFGVPLLPLIFALLLIGFAGIIRNMKNKHRLTIYKGTPK